MLIRGYGCHSAELTHVATDHTGGVPTVLCRPFWTGDRRTHCARTRIPAHPRVHYLPWVINFLLCARYGFITFDSMASQQRALQPVGWKYYGHALKCSMQGMDLVLRGCSLNVSVAKRKPDAERRNVSHRLEWMNDGER